MKHITPISKKNKHRQILILFACLFVVTSCNDIESLPDKIKSDYEFAIPIMDTTVSVGNFVDFNYSPELLDTVKLPEGKEIRMGEQEYPFYIGDYSSSQEITWLEPQITIATKDFPSGTKVNIRIYTKDDSEGKSYFWLPENYSITMENTQVKVPETPAKINEIERFRHSRKVFIDVCITYPTAMLAAQIANDRVNIKFGIRFALKTDLHINL
jgi:hypothetical protein